MDNIEKFQKLKKLSQLKSEFHKENLLAYFDWSKKKGQDDPIEKAIDFGEAGYSLFQMVKKYTSKSSESEEE